MRCVFPCVWILLLLCSLHDRLLKSLWFLLNTFRPNHYHEAAAPLLLSHCFVTQNNIPAVCKSIGLSFRESDIWMWVPSYLVLSLSLSLSLCLSPSCHWAALIEGSMNRTILSFSLLIVKRPEPETLTSFYTHDLREGLTHSYTHSTKYTHAHGPLHTRMRLNEHMHTNTYANTNTHTYTQRHGHILNFIHPNRSISIL